MLEFQSKTIKIVKFREGLSKKKKKLINYLFRYIKLNLWGIKVLIY